MGTLTELEFDALRTRHQEFMEAATRELLDRFSAPDRSGARHECSCRLDDAAIVILYDIQTGEYRGSGKLRGC